MQASHHNEFLLQLLYTTGPMVDALLRFKADSYLVFRLVKR